MVRSIVCGRTLGKRLLWPPKYAKDVVCRIMTFNLGLSTLISILTYCILPLIRFPSLFHPVFSPKI